MQNNKKYQILKKEVKSWIISGKMKEKEQITPEKELAETFQISRQTVRRAIGELVNEGHLYRIQGKGTFVSQKTDQSHVSIQNVGVITNRLFDYIFPDIIQGAEEVLWQNDFGLLLSSTQGSKKKERECLEFMLNKSVRGLIIESTSSASWNENLEYYLTLEQLGIPYVLTNSSYIGLDAPSLTMDDLSSSNLALKHLYDLGHRRIACIANKDVMQGVHRMEGYVRTMRKLGLKIRKNWIGWFAGMTMEGNADPVIKGLLDLPVEERPTAMICYNDEVALVVMDALRRKGISVPDEFSVIGIDDSSVAVATKLTTIAHPKEEMGRKAAEMLVGMIRNQTTYAESIVFEPRLVVRQTTGPVGIMVTN